MRLRTVPRLLLPGLAALLLLATWACSSAPATSEPETAMEAPAAQGLVLGHSAAENFALPNLDRLARGPFVNRARERERFAHYAGALRIRPDAADVPVGTLSGGNQQKVVLAKWLERESRIVIFDEPTRGIDVAVKLEIYELINRLAAEGKAVVLVSSELPELLGMCDRIVVMHGGEVRGEIGEPAEATQEEILAMAVSGAA